MYLLNPNPPHPGPLPKGGRGNPQARELLAAARAADRAADAVSPQEQMAAVTQVLAHQETIRLALMNAQVNRVSSSYREERLPLMAEGDEIGRVEARIPKDLFFHLGQQRNFGWDGFTDNGGMEDFLKAFPQCRVKTVSGKTTVGWRGTQRSASPTRVKFGRGTMEFAR